MIRDLLSMVMICAVSLAGGGIIVLVGCLILSPPVSSEQLWTALSNIGICLVVGILSFGASKALERHG